MKGAATREFITLLGGAVAAPVAWPLATRAQQMPVVGFLHSATAKEFPAQLVGFLLGLKEGGYVEGQNISIEYRWAEGQFDRLPAMAADLVRRQVAVIAALGGNNSVLAAKAATTTIPIVFTSGSDPVRMGFVTSLSRPGGNITGISFLTHELTAKKFGLLHELVPNAGTLGLLYSQSDPEARSQPDDAREATRTLGRELVVVNASTPVELEQAFATLVQRRCRRAYHRQHAVLWRQGQSTRGAGGASSDSNDLRQA